METIETDYLVIGAGAMGMAFTDSLIDHADVHVTLVDRRHGPGGHWLDAYPFVRLHQASQFYGVASTRLGGGEIQQQGPEAGLHERASLPEIQAYFTQVLERRFLPSGQVTFLAGSEHRDDDEGHVVTERLSGRSRRVRVRRRVVDATYLAPTIPATSPPPFGVADGATVATINELVTLADAPGAYVIVGSGKTATDAIVWLLGSGVDSEQLVWVRPREPWMLDRAVVQPDPAVIAGMGADTLEAAVGAASLDEVFLRLEDRGVLLRIDPDVPATMAKTPTLARWELDLLRGIERVVRNGHIREVRPGELVLDGGVEAIPRDALVVHCAASGLRYPPLVPIWAPDRIRLQTIRAGFPCFCAALAGYVEATRDDDAERNRLCPPNLYGNSMAEWARMQVIGAQATAAFGAEDDIDAWANGCLLNPSAVRPDQRDDPALLAATERIAAAAEPGLARLAELAET